jgi:hypothetical protein
MPLSCCLPVTRVSSSNAMVLLILVKSGGRRSGSVSQCQEFIASATRVMDHAIPPPNAAAGAGRGPPLVAVALHVAALLMSAPFDIDLRSGTDVVVKLSRPAKSP